MSERIGTPFMYWTCPVCKSRLQVLEFEDPGREAAAIMLECPTCQHRPEEAGPKLKPKDRNWQVVVVETTHRG